MATQDKDRLLDHEADGIQEYDNALPRWWLYGFYFTIAFGIVYMIYYHFAGGPLSAQEYANELEEAKVKYRATASTTVVATPVTDQASLDAGKAIYEGTNNVCFTCHRNDLGGQVGPNLTDEYWLHGGSFKDITKSISTGYPDKGMLPYGTGTKLDQKQLVQVASYIWSKRGSNPAEPKPIEAARDKKYTLDGQLTQ